MAQTMHTVNHLALVFLLLSPLRVICRMDHLNFGYSMKNVTIPHENEYKTELLNSIHSLDTRMKWKAFHFLNPQLPKSSKETFGLKTSNSPPPIQELKAFQDGLCDIAKNIKFRNVNEQFQNKLKDDLKQIKSDKKIVVPADKTRNHYKMEKEDYNKLLDNNITKDYKKVDENIVNDITKDDKNIAAKLDIEDRLYCTQKRDAFITLKDHTQQFLNNPKCRVINPCKSELGMVSKQMLVEIISTIKAKSHMQQWKNTDAVISWFKSLENKQRLNFIQFDVVNFYASITPTLLEDSITFATRFTEISNETKATILQAAKSFLCSQGNVWVKNEGETFDVTMGGFHGAKIGEVVGLFLLSQILEIIHNVGLYRDDGLCVSSATPREN